MKHNQMIVHVVSNRGEEVAVGGVPNRSRYTIECTLRGVDFADGCSSCGGVSEEEHITITTGNGELAASLRVGMDYVLPIKSPWDDNPATRVSNLPSAVTA